MRFTLAAAILLPLALVACETPQRPSGGSWGNMSAKTMAARTDLQRLALSIRLAKPR